MTFELDATAQRAIVDHLNDDHPEDTLLLCRTLGGEPTAERAWAHGVDVDGLDLRAEVDGTEVAVRLPFAERITERAQVRAEVVRLYERATSG